jgi:hypothetical protein
LRSLFHRSTMNVSVAMENPILVTSLPSATSVRSPEFPPTAARGAPPFLAEHPIGNSPRTAKSSSSAATVAGDERRLPFPGEAGR